MGGPVGSADSPSSAGLISPGNLPPATSGQPPPAASQAQAQAQAKKTPAQCYSWIQPADLVDGSPVLKSLPDSPFPFLSAGHLAEEDACRVDGLNAADAFRDDARRETIDKALRRIDENDRIPGDALVATEHSLLAQHPGDAAFAKILKEQAGIWTETWQAEGRTHEIWDEVLKPCNNGDWNALRNVVLRQITFLAVTSPTVEALNQHVRMLLQQWPDTKPMPPQFREAVETVLGQFMSERPGKAARLVADAYRDQGPLQAAKTLRELTDHRTADPLTAALIFLDAQQTIVKLSVDLLKSDRVAQLAIFRDLSAAVDSASRSPEAGPSIEALATVLSKGFYDRAYDPNFHVITAVRPAVAQGNATLALAMASHLKASGAFESERQANALGGQIAAGLTDLRGSTENSAIEYLKAIAPLVVPLAAWAPFFPDMTPAEWLNSHPGFEETAQARLDATKEQSYALVRATASTQSYLPRLSGIASHKELTGLSTLPASDTQPALGLAIKLSDRAKVEALRLYDEAHAELVDKLGLSPDSSRAFPNPAWAAREVRNFAVRYGALREGIKPYFGLGMRLYGLAACVLDEATIVKDWQRNEGTPSFDTTPTRRSRYAGRFAFLAGATAIEAGFALSQAAAELGIVKETSSGFAGSIARAAAGKGVLAKLALAHSVLFTAYDVVGAVQYFRQGDWQRGSTLMVASASYFFGMFGREKIPGWLFAQFTSEAGAAAGLTPELASVTGSGITMLATFALLSFSLRDELKADEQLQGIHEPLLATRVSPKIAHVLSKIDAGGRCVAPIFGGLSEYLGVEPKQFMQWLIAQDPKWLEWFVVQAFNVRTNSDGSPLISKPQANFARSVQSPDSMIASLASIEFDIIPAGTTAEKLWGIYPTSLEGLARLAAFSGHPLPGGKHSVSLSTRFDRTGPRRAGVVLRGPS
jgi:hypothetical protein